MALALIEADEKIVMNLPAAEGSADYEHRLMICDNPACDCKEVTIHYIPLDSSGREDPSLEPKGVVVELIDHKIKTAPGFTPDRDFEKYLEDVAEEEYYLELNKLYLMYKQHFTREADFASLEIPFPIEDIERTDVMIGYYEVLPFADTFQIEINGQKFLLLDHYCVKMNCSCMDVIFGFEPLDDPNKSSLDYPSYMVHYKKRRWKRFDEDDKRPGPVSTIGELKERIEAASPQIYNVLKQRHSNMKMLYSNSLRAKGMGLPRISEKLVGRNEPCPCGSGKKFKKCCLNRA